VILTSGYPLTCASSILLIQLASDLLDLAISSGRAPTTGTRREGSSALDGVLGRLPRLRA
jgi:hypothetical protein